MVQTKSGARCLEELENGFHGVILMDTMMPDIAGWKTIRKIKARNLENGNIVFMLTVKEDIEVDLIQLTELVPSYMRKPFHHEDIIDTVETFYRRLELAQKAGLISGQ